MPQHAKLSASSAHRWLNCTGAPEFEKNFPSDDKPSVYAMEGTLAHSFCEAAVKYNFNELTKKEMRAEFNRLKKDPLYSPEMEHCAEFYADYIFRTSMGAKKTLLFGAEVRVDFSDWVPEGFGTCDCRLISGDTLHVFDYKHGKGVKVEAEGNPQMRLYALGTWKVAGLLLGGKIKYVHMHIIQPRITEDVSNEKITVEELLAWGESIKPKAEAAFQGSTEFTPGDWCRFCKGASVCEARANMYAALQDFKDLPLEGRMDPAQKKTEDQKAQFFGTPVNYISDARVGELLAIAGGLEQWAADLRSYAESSILAGRPIPGWKIVEGRSIRKITDFDALADNIVSLGYDEDMLYERKPKTITELEKLVGKKEFAAAAGDYVIKPPGKPTLAPASDRRPEFTPAAADFADVQ